MFNFKKLIRQEPDYRIIELEAENNRFKDELIESLKAQIEVLNNHIQLLQVEGKVAEVLVEMPEVRPRISTASQLARLLEDASLIRKKDSENVKTS